jgi:hypothetical protein
MKLLDIGGETLEKRKWFLKLFASWRKILFLVKLKSKDMEIKNMA